MRKDQRRRLMATLLRGLSSKKKSVETFSGLPKRIVILSQEKFGDAILLTPLMKNLKRCFPTCHICVITFGKNQNIFLEDEHTDEVIALRRMGKGSLRFILNRKFDVLFNTKDHPSWTYLWYSNLIRARVKIGIYHSHHIGLYHHLLDVPFQSHIVDKNCALLDYLGCRTNPEDRRPVLNLGNVSSEIKAYCETLPKASLIGINLSAGEPSREWPYEKYKALIATLKEPVIIFSMPDRYEEKKQLETAFPHVLDSPQTKSLFEAGLLIKQLSVLVSPDTSLIHVAACFNVPVVGLYRADLVHLNRFAPYQTRHVQLVSESSDIQDIEVDRVTQAITTLKD
jgi:ADP-heptose:LPS heptosyltransferase